MAQVSDVEADLRALARRVPEDIRESLSSLELRLRCEEAASLIGDAETCGDDRKAGRLRVKANRVLKAMSPRALDLAIRVLGDELRQARLDGNDRGAYEIQAQMSDLIERNPQPSPERVMAAATAAITRQARNQLKIPPPLPSWESGFTRRFGKGRKHRRR